MVPLKKEEKKNVLRFQLFGRSIQFGANEFLTRPTFIQSCFEGIQESTISLIKTQYNFQGQLGNA